METTQWRPAVLRLKSRRAGRGPSPLPPSRSPPVHKAPSRLDIAFSFTRTLGALPPGVPADSLLWLRCYNLFQQPLCCLVITLKINSTNTLYNSNSRLIPGTRTEKWQPLNTRMVRDQPQDGVSIQKPPFGKQDNRWKGSILCGQMKNKYIQ